MSQALKAQPQPSPAVRPGTAGPRCRRVAVSAKQDHKRQRIPAETQQLGRSTSAHAACLAKGSSITRFSIRRLGRRHGFSLDFAPSRGAATAEMAVPRSNVLAARNEPEVTPCRLGQATPPLPSHPRTRNSDDHTAGANWTHTWISGGRQRKSTSTLMQRQDWT